MLDWRRKEITTRGPDPTVVVEWKVSDPSELGEVKEISITEFQNVYIVRFDGAIIDNPLIYWEEKHKMLERGFYAELDARGEEQIADRAYHGGR